MIGGVLVTALEFITGLIVNVWLGLNVWDYSNLPLNLMGQICLPFFFAWVGLSVVAIILDDYEHYIEHELNKEAQTELGQSMSMMSDLWNTRSMQVSYWNYWMFR